MPLKVLVIDRAAPLNPRQGNALIAIEVMRRLAHHEIVLVAPGVASEEDAERLAEMFAEVHLVPRARWTPALSGSFEPVAMDRFSRLPAMDLRAARAVAEAVRSVSARRPFDVVHVRQLPMAGYAADLRPKKLLELIDSETLGAERTRPRTVRTMLRAVVAARVEERAMAGFDIVTAVAEADAERLRRLRPCHRIDVVPNGVDTERFAPEMNEPEEDTTLVFVGAMSFGPNVAAMQWFCAHVFPTVRALHPQARLEIVGRGPSDAVRSLEEIDGVTVTGEVDDVRPYLARATAFVAPMVSGSGIKNKVLEAMAMRLPVVATPLGVEGLALVPDEEVLVAPTAGAMAQAIVELLDDPMKRRSIGASARAVVEQRYTWDACAASYERLWHELAAADR